jgi:hypothetical protein
MLRKAPGVPRGARVQRDKLSRVRPTAPHSQPLAGFAAREFTA